MLPSLVFKNKCRLKWKPNMWLNPDYGTFGVWGALLAAGETIVSNKTFRFFSSWWKFLRKCFCYVWVFPSLVIKHTSSVSFYSEAGESFWSYIKVFFSIKLLQLQKFFYVNNFFVGSFYQIFTINYMNHLTWEYGHNFGKNYIIFWQFIHSLVAISPTDLATFIILKKLEFCAHHSQVEMSQEA